MKKIGLIAGGSRYPLYFARAARRQGVEIVALAIEEETEKELEKYVDSIHWVKAGELGKLFGVLREEGIKEAVMAGKVTKTLLFDPGMPFDQELKNLLCQVEDKKDISLLQAVAARLEKNGVTLIDSTTYLEDLLPEKGVLSQRGPTEGERADIEFGSELARKIAGMDIGMTVVVKDKVVLAVEAIEGTDEAIRRGGKLGNGGAVVVKVGRPRQDMRFDLPVVGPGTVDSLVAVRAAVLAVEAKKTLLIDQEVMLRTADQNGIAVVGI